MSVAGPDSAEGQTAGAHGDQGDLHRERADRRSSSRSRGPGTLPLPTSGAADGPPRIFFDFPGVALKAPAVTASTDPRIRRIRAAVNSVRPLVTRVVLDLVALQPYRLEGGPGRVRVIVGEAGNVLARGIAPVPSLPEPRETGASVPRTDPIAACAKRAGATTSPARQRRRPRATGHAAAACAAASRRRGANRAASAGAPTSKAPDRRPAPAARRPRAAPPPSPSTSAAAREGCGTLPAADLARARSAAAAGAVADVARYRGRPDRGSRAAGGGRIRAAQAGTGRNQAARQPALRSTTCCCSRRSWR